MAEESGWSRFLKSFRDSLGLVREVAILAILAVLVFDASRITPILTKIGLALENAGFTEVNIGGVKQDLTRLREKIEDTGLNAQQAQESLTKAKSLLQQAQGEPLDAKVARNINEAISSISLSQERLGFAKQQIQQATLTVTPGTATPIGTTPATGRPWVIVVGADNTLEAAEDEVTRAQSRGFDNARIILRDGWYRTVIPFATDQEAEARLPQISNQIRDGSFLRDLNKWCELLEPTEINSVKFEKCTPRRTG